MTSPDPPEHGTHVRAHRALVEQHAGLLDEEESNWLAGHLAQCRDCRSVADDLESADRTVPGSGGHLPVRLTSRWNTESLKLAGVVREYVFAHLRNCETCRAEVRLVGHRLPAEIEHAVSREIVPKRGGGWWARVTEGPGKPWAIGGALATVAGLLIALVTLPQRTIYAPSPGLPSAGSEMQPTSPAPPPIAGGAAPESPVPELSEPGPGSSPPAPVGISDSESPEDHARSLRELESRRGDGLLAFSDLDSGPLRAELEGRPGTDPGATVGRGGDSSPRRPEISLDQFTLRSRDTHDSARVFAVSREARSLVLHHPEAVMLIEREDIGLTVTVTTPSGRRFEAHGLTGLVRADRPLILLMPDGIEPGTYHYAYELTSRSFEGDQRMEAPYRGTFSIRLR